MKTFPKPRVLLNLGLIFFMIPTIVFILKVGLQDKKSVIIIVICFANILQMIKEGY